MALQPDLLTRVRNIHWGGGVYVIICADGTHATAGPDAAEKKGVKVIATRTDPNGPTIIGGPLSATLLEAPATAGANFAFIDATAGSHEAAERIEVIVVPRTKQAKDDWFNMYVVPVSYERTLPSAPFLWLLQTMNFDEPRLIAFKIRNEPHINDGTVKGKAPMVQMYPMSDTTPTTSQFGYAVWAYRTDTNGTKALYQPPPEWYPDIITNINELGLLFEKEPPLIAADIPYPVF